MNGRIDNPFTVGSKVRIAKGTKVASTDPRRGRHTAGRAQTVEIRYVSDGFKPNAVDQRGCPPRIGFEGSCGYWSYVDAREVELVEEEG